MKSIKIKRKINSTLLRIKEMESFKGKDVELRINISKINSAAKINKTAGLSGIFSNYADKNKAEIEKDAWVIAVKEKHQNYGRQYYPAVPD